MATPFIADPLVLAPAAAAAALYAAGCAALRRGDRGGSIHGFEAAAFAGGLACVVVALAPSVDGLSARFFSVHMVEHELLVLVAAPLVAVGRPFVPFLAALPARLQPRALGLARREAVLRTWAFLTAPLVAVVLHAAAIWAWHAPALFDAALESRPLHAVQHASLFLTAVLFWWSLVHGRGGRGRCGTAVAAAFLTAAHTALLGAILALAPAPLYRSYAALLGARALPDQAAAGLVLCVPAGALFALVGVKLLADGLGLSGAPRSGAARAAST